MNPELQKSLEVTSLSGSLDSYMLIVLLIMIVAGVLGGVANYFLSDRQNEANPRDWAKYPILGVIAALTVPLFLNMISSNLLEAARTRPVDFFVFAGFCLIYVVASRRVFENVANKLLNQMDQMKREMVQIKQQRAEASAPALRDEPAALTEMPLPAVKPEVIKESLSYKKWTTERLQPYYSHVEMLFSPDLFVVGGGVSKDWDKFGPLLELRTPIVPATMRNRAGIVGAALFAKDLAEHPDPLIEQA